MDTNSNNVIETRSLSFSFRKNLVLDNLNIKIPRNSIYGLIGRNGAGKTTIIKLLVGLLSVPKKTVYYYGKDFSDNQVEIMRFVGCLIENPSLYNDLTCIEHFVYLNYFYNMDNSRIEEVLKMVGLWQDREKKAKYLSLGMKQRLGIGMALFHNPDIIILDEPMNGLDPLGIYEFRSILEMLKAQNKTIIISSHMLSEVEKICTHIGIIDNCRLVFQDDISYLNKQGLETLFFDLIK